MKNSKFTKWKSYIQAHHILGEKSDQIFKLNINIKKSITIKISIKNVIIYFKKSNVLFELIIIWF